MWIGDWLRLWENESEDPSRKESIIIHQFSGDEAIICWSCSGALAIVTRINQCLPPDVWGPTQMLNINIIQCNWTSVTRVHRGAGLWRAHLQHSSSNGLGVTTRKSDFMDVYKTSNSTCTLYLSIAVAFMLLCSQCMSKIQLTHIQCPVLNSYSSLHAAIWRLMPSAQLPQGVGQEVIFSHFFGTKKPVITKLEYSADNRSFGNPRPRFINGNMDWP